MIISYQARLQRRAIGVLIFCFTGVRNDDRATFESGLTYLKYSFVKSATAEKNKETDGITMQTISYKLRERSQMFHYKGKDDPYL